MINDVNIINDDSDIHIAVRLLRMV
jgi:hypothetical protein